MMELENKMVSAKDMLQYLQSMLDKFMELQERYGMENDMTLNMFYSMIACKEMVEVMIGMPVNLQRDGKVTVGF